MIMTTITVYDPPMCCSTGVCGPDVDPKLAQFAGDLDWLKGQGVEVRRFNLAQEPAAFVEHPEIKALLDRSGGEDLPAIIVGTKLTAHGRYPTRTELAELAGLAETKPAAMPEEVRELIALGAAIAASCEPCFKSHHDKARKLGVSAGAMREAVQIGEAVKQASAMSVLSLADRMLGSQEPVNASSACCGGAKAPEPKAKSGCC
jgi:AhpD family alkylhydroperoxidase